MCLVRMKKIFESDKDNHYKVTTISITISDEGIITVTNDFVNKYRSATPTSINGQAANILRNKLNVPAQTTIAESKAITKAMDDLEKAKQLKDNEIVIEKLYPQLKSIMKKLLIIKIIQLNKIYSLPV